MIVSRLYSWWEITRDDLMVCWHDPFGRKRWWPTGGWQKKYYLFEAMWTNFLLSGARYWSYMEESAQRFCFIIKHIIEQKSLTFWLWNFFGQSYYQLWLEKMAILSSLLRLLDIGNSLALSPNLYGSQNFFTSAFLPLISSVQYHSGKKYLSKGVSCQLRNHAAQACQCEKIETSWNVMMMFVPNLFCQTV